MPSVCLLVFTKDSDQISFPSLGVISDLIVVKDRLSLVCIFWSAQRQSEKKNTQCYLEFWRFANKFFSNTKLQYIDLCQSDQGSLIYKS